MSRYVKPATLLVLATFLILGLPMQAAAENSHVSVIVDNQTISLTKLALLQFGTIVPYGRDGSVQMTTGDVSITDNVYVSLPGQASRWGVDGIPNAYYAITLPADGTIQVTDGTNLMAVDSFVHDAGPTPRLDATGHDEFAVGATLHVNANQPSGSYNAQYSVLVAYN